MLFHTRVRRLLTKGLTTAKDAAGGDAAGNGATEDAVGAPAGDRRRVRRIAAQVTTILACLLVLSALVAPDEVSRLTMPAAFVRIPVEGLLGVAAVLVAPAAARRVLVALLGVLLALLTVVNALDMGFFAVLDRPFDLVLDWTLFDDAMAFLTDSIGRVAAIGSVVAAVVAVLVLIIFMTLSVRRLTRLVVRHRNTATRAVVVLGTVWVTCALLGAQILPGVPVASRSASALLYDHALQVGTDLRDQRSFARQAAVDTFRDTPGEQLLTALRGKDVIFTFVESYGRSAIEDPKLASQVDPVLDAGNRQLAAAGFASRSAFLTSPTAGGGSWLAHATLQSGLWINNKQRYDNLLAGHRLTLTGACRRAGWQAIGVEPGNTYAWPEGAFYGYDRVYDSHNMGYHGPTFSWSTMPDQYALASFERSEYGRPDRARLMAEVTLTSSHTPWAPLPQFADWDAVGDGSVYGPMAKDGDPPDVVWRDPARVRTEYARSIAYSLNSLISFVSTYGNDNLVLVFLGDHQPATIVTGRGASRDVPVTIVARDRAVLNRISGWGWQDGLKPGPRAPVWRMDAFRDRFLTAFGPQGGPTPSLSLPSR